MSSLFARAVILVEGETELAAIPKWLMSFWKLLRRQECHFGFRPVAKARLFII